MTTAATNLARHVPPGYTYGDLTAAPLWYFAMKDGTCHVVDPDWMLPLSHWPENGLPSRFWEMPVRPADPTWAGYQRPGESVTAFRWVDVIEHNGCWPAPA